MSEKHHDEVGGVKVGHGDIPKFLYPVYIGLLLWAAYYFIIDDGSIGYARPKLDENSWAGILQKRNCESCHQASGNGIGPAFSKTKEFFKSKEELLKYLDDPTKAPVTNPGNAVVMKGQSDGLSADEKKIIADELMK